MYKVINDDGVIIEDTTIHIEHINQDVWSSAKELVDNIHHVPPEMIFETQKNCDDAIQLLRLAKLGLEQKQN